MARSTARAAVMQMIFENLAGGEGGEDTLAMVYEALRHEGIPGVEIAENEPNKSDKAYIARVLDGVLNNLDELDAAIQEASPRWNVNRMPKVDLTILRMAVYELKYMPEVPVGATINEAVDLSKQFCEDKSSGFINGILGSVARAMTNE